MIGVVIGVILVGVGVFFWVKEKQGNKCAIFDSWCACVRYQHGCCWACLNLEG